MSGATINPRINASLLYYRLDRIARDPSGIEAVRIPDYSGWFAPSVEDVGPAPLDWPALARLACATPVTVELRLGGGRRRSVPVVALPLSTWSMREEHRRASAAFVMDNSRFVASLLAAEELDAGSSDSLQAAEKLYDVIRAVLRLHYLWERELPGDHEQILRLPRQVFHDGGGTCADLALLYAAGLLRAGCDPVLGVLRDPYNYAHRHELVGVWKDGTRMEGSPIEIGAAALRQLARDRVVFVEPNWLTRLGGSFAGAMREAKRTLADMEPLWGIDVRAARDSHLGPLPGVVQTGSDGEVVVDDLPCRPADRRTRSRLVLPAAAPPFTLEVVSAALEEDRVSRPLRRPFVRLGHPTSGRCDIAFHDERVSRAHANLMVEGDRVWIQDLHSRNGTLLTGRRLQPLLPVEVSPGDDIILAPPDGIRLRLVRQGSAR